MAYVLLVDEVERNGLVGLIVAAIAAAGGSRVDWTPFIDARAQFDAALHADPEHVDPDQVALMQALGLREG